MNANFHSRVVGLLSPGVLTGPKGTLTVRVAVASSRIARVDLDARRPIRTASALGAHPVEAGCGRCETIVPLARRGDACTCCGGYQLNPRTGEHVWIKELEVA
jgi:hypothetical protein